VSPTLRSAPLALLAYLLVEAERVQQLDAQQQADLVGLLGHVEVALQVAARQGVEYAAVHQVALEGLRVLGQPHVTQPRLGHPVVVQVRCLGQPINTQLIIVGGQEGSEGLGSLRCHHAAINMI